MSEGREEEGEVVDTDATVVELSAGARVGKARVKDARRATEGYFNPSALGFSLEVSNRLRATLLDLAAENEDANNFVVFFAVSRMLEETGLDQNDHTLVALGALLSPLEVGEDNPLFTIAAQNAHKKGEKGEFARLLRENLTLAGPALFELFERLKAERIVGSSVEIAQPQAETATRVQEVVGGEDKAVEAGNIKPANTSRWTWSRVARLLRPW